ncbi:MAG TPA: hypothetical protein VLD40_04110, partial [Dissulfurispiraceae bacterium]|nr:hypothetical protein [Dissulfurispiraceae bacterium]
LTFAFPEDVGLFVRSDNGAADERPSGTIPRLFPDRRARYSFAAMHSLSGIEGAALSGSLWDLSWQGKLSNDSFAIVRQGILNKFRYHEPKEKSLSRRSPASRWKAGRPASGNWYLLDDEREPQDVIEREETNKDRVRVLLDRYGILFRELLARELPMFQWQRIFRTLRLMELSGEILSGCFFSGIPGPQFLSHEAYRLLTRGLPQDRIYWLNAADPASLCGTGLDALRGHLAPRTPTTHLVYHDTRLVVVSRRYGRELLINVGPDDARLREYLSFFTVLLSRDFNPLKRILIEKINGRPTRTSAYRDRLREFGFHDSYKGLELVRSYP